MVDAEHGTSRYLNQWWPSSMVHICIISHQASMSLTHCGLVMPSCHQTPWSTLIQVISWCLFVTKPLPDPMPSYCELDPYKQISVIYESKYNNFNPRKYSWKWCLQSGSHFVQTSVLSMCKGQQKHNLMFFKWKSLHQTIGNTSWWLSARLQYLQCIDNWDTAVLH